MYIAIENVLIDETLYPRNQTYWKHIAELMGALRVGSTLPPIVVGKRGKRYVIIDGRHRCEAHRRLKRQKIAAMVTHLPKREWFGEAVRLNCTHGHGLSYQEKIAAGMILQRDNYDPKQIAEIIQIPLEALEKAIEQRGAWLHAEDVRPTVAKASIAPEAKRRGRDWLESAAANGLDAEQKILGGSSFERLSEELLVLLRGDHLDDKNEEVVGLVNELVTAATDWLEQHAAKEAA